MLNEVTWGAVFDYPLNLHISQTRGMVYTCRNQFDYPLNLHISQTGSSKQQGGPRLIILWIYISLKRQASALGVSLVWLSFEFTYLSNKGDGIYLSESVWLSFEFTYLSNYRLAQNRLTLVWLSFEFTYLSNLSEYRHLIREVWLSFEFTYLSNAICCVTIGIRFDYPLNLHISQTKRHRCLRRWLFDYPLNLHISQT